MTGECRLPPPDAATKCPHRALWRSPRLSPLILATQDSSLPGVMALVSALSGLNPPSLWIDFTAEQRHHYGLVDSLLYPYFSSRWDRAMTIFSSHESGGESAFASLRAGHPAAILLQKGSLLSDSEIAALGYRVVVGNAEGTLYAH